VGYVMSLLVFNTWLEVLNRLHIFLPTLSLVDAIRDTFGRIQPLDQLSSVWVVGSGSLHQLLRKRVSYATRLTTNLEQQRVLANPLGRFDKKCWQLRSRIDHVTQGLCDVSSRWPMVK